MTKKLGQKQLDAWIALILAHGTLTKELDRRMAAAGLPSMEVYDVLLHLETSEDGHLKMSELADRALFSRSGVTRLVDRLEKEGLVERVSCPTDRRVIRARITKKGLETRENAWPTYRSHLAELFGAKLNDAEAQQLALLLGRFSNRPCRG